MGESHYGTPEENEPGNTLRIMELCAFRTSGCSASFTKALNIVGEAFAIERHRDDKAELWSKLAYSNFVQDLLSQSRKAPSEEEWARGQRAFFDQLRLTRPPILLILGWRTWQNLPRNHSVQFKAIGPIGPDSVELTEPRAYVYMADGRCYCTQVVAVAHPSGRGFSTAKAAARLRTAHRVMCGVSASHSIEAAFEKLTAKAS